MTDLSEFKNEKWDDIENGRPVVIEQIVGNSGVYLVVTDKATGEVIRDGRPWQMREGVS